MIPKRNIWRASQTGSTRELNPGVAAMKPRSMRGDGYADLKYVYAAAAEIAEHFQDYTVIVDKSTVPVGTAREVHRIVKKTNPNAEFDVASTPEFLRGYQSGTSIDCTSFSPLWYSNQWVSRIISKL